MFLFRDYATATRLLVTRLNRIENYKLSGSKIARLERLQGCKLARSAGLNILIQTFTLEGIERSASYKLEAYSSQSWTELLKVLFVVTV